MTDLDKHLRTNMEQVTRQAFDLRLGLTVGDSTTTLDQTEKRLPFSPNLDCVWIMSYFTHPFQDFMHLGGGRGDCLLF